MSFLTKIKEQSSKGFTLVELMIVLVIVGVLATIALPSYQSYVNKSRQSEAKLALGSQYTAMTSFNFENGTYNSCVVWQGGAVGSGDLYYSTGFSNAGAVTALCEAAGNVNCATAAGMICSGGLGDGANVVEATTAAGVAQTDEGDLAALDAIAQNTFTLGSAGAIGGTQQDHWTMDQAKTLSNVQSGVN